MPASKLGPPIDPNFPEYAYTGEPLVAVCSRPGRGKTVANVFLGEWMKLLSNKRTGWLPVAFRGGKGYVRAGQLTRRRHLEIFFIDVDQGDAILIQTPDDRRILIDGGKSDDAHQFIINKYRLDKPDHYVDFEAVVATHSDDDHTGGLVPILSDARIAAKRIYHNGLFRRKDSKKDPGPRKKGKVFSIVDAWPDETATLTATMKKFVAAAKEARKRLPGLLETMAEEDRWAERVDFDPNDFVFKRLDAAEGFLPPYDDSNKHVTIEVLWPRAQRSGGKLCYRWYGDAGHTVNGNCVVLMIRHGDNRILLTGDLNDAAMDDMLKRYGKAADCPLCADVYKAGHHGSQHFSVPFLKAVAPNAAVISSGDNKYDQYGHPRAVLLGTITRYSKAPKPAVFSTELAACFRKLPARDLGRFRAGDKRQYERAIQGTVHLRSDGRHMYLGTVHGRKPPPDLQANINWKWDIWPED